jgi:hypothetical protein
MGSSHAGKLAAAIRRTGSQPKVIYEANSRINRNAIIDMAEKITKKLTEGHVDKVILCIWDNSMHYGLADSGETQPAKRDSNGVFHVEGDLIIASKSARHALFSTARPMIDSMQTTCPTSRLRGAAAERSKGDGQEFPGLLFHGQLKAGQEPGPICELEGDNRGELFGDDPVHPKEEAFQKLAVGVLLVLTCMWAKKSARTQQHRDCGSGPSASSEQ